ncbi:retrovirus-related Pol polyprotein from transposon 17.6 [Trichonephila clavipes]|nr:retrovirus-related Pol polyprotein from transposon 17.6 [Trichonephila clavipes]
MLKHLHLDIFELQETKLLVRLINTTDERKLVQVHETTPLKVKGDIEDVSSELDNGDLKKENPFSTIKHRGGGIMFENALEAFRLAIANALLENYVSRYGAPISLISDNGPQFISEVFEHLSHRLDIKHIKTVTYRQQVNLMERVNHTLVQMIASFLEENHDNWDRFLHQFAFALRTSVNETTGKTPAELFLGRKIITPFSKLINVTEGAEYVGRNIEKLFDEARQNMRKQHKNWGKYYNRKRREVNIKVNDLVSVQTHFMSAAGRRVVGKFMPKFEAPYSVGSLE